MPTLLLALTLATQLSVKPALQGQVDLAVTAIAKGAMPGEVRVRVENRGSGASGSKNSLTLSLWAFPAAGKNRVVTASDGGSAPQAVTAKLPLPSLAGKSAKWFPLMLSLPAPPDTSGPQWAGTPRVANLTADEFAQAKFGLYASVGGLKSEGATDADGSNNTFKQMYPLPDPPKLTPARRSGAVPVHPGVATMTASPDLAIAKFGSPDPAAGQSWGGGKGVIVVKVVNHGKGVADGQALVRVTLMKTDANGKATEPVITGDFQTSPYEFEQEVPAYAPGDWSWASFQYVLPRPKAKSSGWNLDLPKGLPWSGPPVAHNLSQDEYKQGRFGWRVVVVAPAGVKETNVLNNAKFVRHPLPQQEIE